MPLTPDVRQSIDQIRPCKGPAAALQDLNGGSVHCGFLAKPTAVAHVKRGKLIGLAVTAAGRSPVAMKLPTMSEAGSAGFEASFGQLPLAPKGIPPAVVAALNETFSAALARADARAKMLAMDCCRRCKSVTIRWRGGGSVVRDAETLKCRWPREGPSACSRGSFGGVCSVQNGSSGSNSGGGPSGTSCSRQACCTWGPYASHSAWRSSCRHSKTAKACSGVQCRGIGDAVGVIDGVDGAGVLIEPPCASARPAPWRHARPCAVRRAPRPPWRGTRRRRCERPRPGASADR